MGLVTAIVLYPVISTSNRHKMIMWGCRLAMIPVAVVLFVVLIRNFYSNDPYAGGFPNLSFFGACLSLTHSHYQLFGNSLPMVPILVLYPS